MPFTLRFLAVAAGLASLGGCCSEVTSTQCFEWNEPTTCPDPEDAAPRLGDGSGEVEGPGTFWPAHEYRINGERWVEPPACCYEVTATTCTKELH